MWTSPQSVDGSLYWFEFGSSRFNLAFLSSGQSHEASYKLAVNQIIANLVITKPVDVCVPLTCMQIEFDAMFQKRV